MTFAIIFATFYDSGTKLVEWGRITGLARFLNRVMALTISLISLHIADHRTSALLIKMWTLMMRIDQCWCTTQITSDQIERSSDHILITKLILILSYSSSAITLKDLKRDKVRKKTTPDQQNSNSLSSVGFLGWSESNSGNIASRRFKLSSHTRSHIARHWPVEKVEKVIFGKKHFFSNRLKILTWCPAQVLLTCFWFLGLGSLSFPFRRLSDSSLSAILMERSMIVCRVCKQSNKSQYYIYVIFK